MFGIAQIIMLVLGAALIYFSTHEDEDFQKILLLRVMGFALIIFVVISSVRNLIH